MPHLHYITLLFISMVTKSNQIVQYII